MGALKIAETPGKLIRGPGSLDGFQENYEENIGSALFLPNKRFPHVQRLYREIWRRQPGDTITIDASRE
jgi:hypothetical protein